MLQTLALAVNTSGLSAAPELSSTHQYSGGGVTANQNRLWSVKSWLFRGRMWALSPKRKLLWLSPRRCYYNKEKQFKKNSCPFFIISSRSGSNSHHQQIKETPVRTQDSRNPDLRCVCLYPQVFIQTSLLCQCCA